MRPMRVGGWGDRGIHSEAYTLGAQTVAWGGMQGMTPMFTKKPRPKKKKTKAFHEYLAYLVPLAGVK